MPRALEGSIKLYTVIWELRSRSGSYLLPRKLTQCEEMKIDVLSAIEAGGSPSIGGSSTTFRNCPSEAIGREVKVGVLTDAVFVRFTQ